MYGGDDNRMIVYYMERWPKKRGRKNIREKRNPEEESTEYCKTVFIKNILEPSSSDCAEDRYFLSYLYLKHSILQ